MPLTIPFSRRYAFAPQKQPRPRDEVPVRVRGEFLHILDQVSPGLLAMTDPFKRAFYEQIRPYIWEVLEKPPPNIGSLEGTFDAIEAIGKTIYQCEWFKFYDICELAYEVLAEKLPRRLDGFESAVNEIFAMDLLPWCFKDGLITPARPAEITEIFEQAKSLLSDPRFMGPDEQFRKANQHLAKRPDPDTENCVKDAVGSLEGIARIVTKQPDRTLGQILNREPLKSMVPSLLLAAIEKVYAYRGDAPGVAHGQTGPSTIGIEEADWVLSMCAATMVYLAKRYSS